MGGLGSGRHDYATTPTVEECRYFDADEVTEVIKYPVPDHVEWPYIIGRKWWGDRDDPDVEIGIRAEGVVEIAGETLADRLRLVYTVRPKSGDSTEYRYSVPLEYTEPNYGGVRPWFRCPGVVDGERCGRRVRKLYLPPRQELFLCRECYDLGYRSSRISGDPVEQAELRYRRAFAKADAENRRPHPNNAPYYPDKPKGMHHDTFADFADDVQAARREWDDAMQARTQELLNRQRDFLDRHEHLLEDAAEPDRSEG